jgi:hypothetical protein
MEKQCSKCKQIKTINEFRKDKYSKDGYTTRCKYCIDHKYKNICLQCGKEFFGSHIKQKLCSKECSGKYNTKQVKFNCDCCGKDSTMCEAEFYREGKSHHYCSKECKDSHHSELISNQNHPNWKGGNIISKCDYCGKEISYNLQREERSKHHYCSTECSGKHKAIINRGENSYNWKGGSSYKYNTISSLLRNSTIDKWREDSINSSNGKCVASGLPYDCVHHLYGFNFILSELLDITKIELKDKTSDYTESEIITLKETCLELHYKYGLGVCLTNDIHEEFHKIYGYGDNTPEQFKEFLNNKLDKTA